MERLISALGLLGLIGLAWLLSTQRRKLPVRTILAGLVIQLLFAVFIFLVPAGEKLFQALNNIVVVIIDAGMEGGRFVFGSLAMGSGEKGSVGLILAFQAFPTIIFFAALMQVLYFFKLLPWLIRLFAMVFRKAMGLSGVESLCAACNIFVGIESLTTIRPYLRQASLSELCAILTAGMATIASSILGFYVIVLREQFPQIAGHLIAASVLSAPAALVMAKVLVPEPDEDEVDRSEATLTIERDDGVFAAIVNGAMAGGKLVFGIVVVLIAMLGLVAVLNLGIEGVTGCTLQDLLAYVFYPFALLIGVVPADAMTVARLLGERLIMTEVTAYQSLATLIQDNGFQSVRSVVLASYALCGFAHVASMAIFTGGLAALVPERTGAITKIAPRALLAATLACLMTAAVAGLFIQSP